MVDRWVRKKRPAAEAPVFSGSQTSSRRFWLRSSEAASAVPSGSYSALGVQSDASIIHEPARFLCRPGSVSV
jgi:hypothetical protein